MREAIQICFKIRGLLGIRKRKINKNGGMKSEWLRCQFNHKSMEIIKPTATYSFTWTPSQGQYLNRSYDESERTLANGPLIEGAYVNPWLELPNKSRLQVYYLGLISSCSKKKKMLPPPKKKNTKRYKTFKHQIIYEDSKSSKIG